jgi:hypothetical protein
MGPPVSLPVNVVPQELPVKLLQKVSTLLASQPRRIDNEAGALKDLRNYDQLGTALIIATHDSALGLAAQAFGFEVRGL